MAVVDKNKGIASTTKGIPIETVNVLEKVIEEHLAVIAVVGFGIEVLTYKTNDIDTVDVADNVKVNR